MRLLGEHGIVKDDSRGRRELAARMNAQRGLENDAATLSQLRHGWRLGGEDFLDRLMSRTKVRGERGHGRQVHEETEEGVARQILREELEKANCARRLRRETALTLPRIADLLKMGAPTYVSHLLYHRKIDV